MASKFWFLIVVFVTSHVSNGYIDLGIATRPREEVFHPTPRPYRDLPDSVFRYDILPSMITAVAPSVTMASNGTFETMYSVHYHELYTKRYMGKGVFKRGVFASDPPIPTCTPCGGGGGSSSNFTNGNATNPSVTCTTHTYLGVFRTPDPASVSSICYNSSYSGILSSATTSSYTLPCCFTIPASCLANSSSISYTYTTGVFRSSTTMGYFSNFTTTTSTASPASSTSLITASSTGISLSSSGVTNPSSRSTASSTASSSTSGSSRTSMSSSYAGTSRSSLTSSSLSTSPGVSSLTTTMSQRASYSYSPSFPSASSSFSSTSGITSITTPSPLSVVVISSTTITIPISNTGANGPRPGTQTVSTITVITATPSYTSTSPSLITTTVPNTIDGCGTASGSGILIGSGTVYVGPGALIPVISSGTASGYARKVVGCGTIIATLGTFSGSATIIGCGAGSGTATMTGSGTVWPAFGGGVISFVSSGVLTGSGSVRGCGTITGSGVFSASEPYTKTITPIPSASKTTVEVYLSYCPTSIAAAGMPHLAGNFTSSSPSFRVDNDNNSTLSAGNGTGAANSTKNDNEGGSSNQIPICNICPESAGICCPPDAECGEDGRCPWNAMIRSGYVLHGYNVAEARNSTADIADRREIDAKA